MNITVRPDVLESVYPAELVEALTAAVDLANAADTLLKLARGDVNPIVVARAHLEPLRIARGRLVDVADRHRLILAEVPA